MRSTRKIGTVAAVSAAAMAAVAGSFAAAGGDHRAVAESEVPVAVGLSGLERFSAFAAKTEVPDETVTGLLETMGAEPATARRIGADGRTWAAVGREVVCIASVTSPTTGHVAAACNRRADLAEGVVGFSRPKPAEGDVEGDGGTYVFALVPDGAETVEYSLGGGDTATLPVANNAVAGVLPSHPRSARFVDTNGAQHLVKFAEVEDKGEQP